MKFPAPLAVSTMSDLFPAAVATDVAIASATIPVAIDFMMFIVLSVSGMQFNLKHPLEREGRPLGSLSDPIQKVLAFLRAFAVIQARARSVIRQQTLLRSGELKVRARRTFYV
jgi:hypothetical protein